MLLVTVLSYLVATLSQPNLAQAYLFKFPKFEEDQFAGYTSKSLTEIQEICGNKHVPHREARIIKGAMANFVKHRHIVVITYPTKKPFCGGLLIHPMYVLTAGHCVQNWSPKNNLIMGAENLNYSTNNMEIRFSKKITLHEKFDNNELFYDLALIELNKPVYPNSFVNYACLIPPGVTCESFANQKAYMVGYGKIDPNPLSYNTSLTLKEAVLPVWSTDDCKKTYADVKFADYYVCAGYARGRKDSCGGDSGGPLMVDGLEFNFILGVASWGFDCGQRMKPGVYICLADFLPWIVEKVDAGIKNHQEALQRSGPFRRLSRIRPYKK